MSVDMCHSCLYASLSRLSSEQVCHIGNSSPGTENVAEKKNREGTAENGKTHAAHSEVALSSLEFGTWCAFATIRHGKSCSVCVRPEAGHP